MGNLVLVLLSISMPGADGSPAQVLEGHTRVEAAGYNYSKPAVAPNSV